MQSCNVLDMNMCSSSENNSEARKCIMNIRRQQTDFGTPNTSRLGHHVFFGAGDWGCLSRVETLDLWV